MKTNTYNLIELATIVYSNSDDEISCTKNDIISKIIQLSIYCNNNNFQTASEISKYIKNKLGLIVFEEEIWSTIMDNKQKFVVKNDAESNEYKDNKHTLLALSQDEFIKIKTESNTNSFDELISTFYKKECDDNTPLEAVKDLILDFIYKHFVDTIKNYKELVVENSNRYSDDFLQNLKSVVKYDYPPQQCEIINKFIDFEDAKKNKYIFYVLTLALEYCITLNLPNGSIPNNILRKKLYLDTNIIFRALGLNGEDRQDKILIFLEKCVKTGQKLYITDITQEEFIKSIESQCNGLAYLKSATQEGYNYLAADTDLTSFYLGKKRTNPGLNPQIFRAEIQAEYSKLKEKYSLSIEYVHDIAERNIIPQINSLFELKNPNMDNLNIKEICKNDIYNLNYLSKRTKPSDFYPNILFISADRKLLYWIKNNGAYNNYTNFSLQPSDWLSFMLRFISRSDDEYKSFVDLLKITPISDLHFEPYQIAIIFGLVDKVESDPINQEVIIKNMVSNQFNEVKYISEIKDKEEFAANIDSIVAKEIKELYASEVIQLKEKSKEELLEKDKVINEKNFETSNQNKELKKLNDDFEKLKEQNLSASRTLIEKDAILLEKEIDDIKNKLIIKYLVLIFIIILFTYLLKSSIAGISTPNSLLYTITSTFFMTLLTNKIEKLELPTYKKYKNAKDNLENFKKKNTL